MNTPENPPAFPFVEPPDAGFNVSTGMTLRDWFAGQALAGLAGDRAGCEAPELAADAYAFADAMLSARTTNPAEP